MLNKAGHEAALKYSIGMIASFALISLLAAMTVPAYASNVSYLNTYQTVIQTQWRSDVGFGTSFGTLTATYDDSCGCYTYVATGHSLHEMFQYEPYVTNQQGGNHSYTFDGTNYVMHSGIVSYTSPYSGLTIYEVWNGWISFNDALISSNNQLTSAGQLNQWGFVYDPSGTTVLLLYPYAQSMSNGYWLVGFSTYTYGSTSAPDTTYPSGAFWTLALNPPHLP